MELFTLHSPQAPELPILANMPHSGMFVPDSIATQMLPEFLQALPNTDWHLDKLYRSLPHLGITVLQANYSRYVVDLNRSLRTPVFGNFWRSVVAEKTGLRNQPIYQTRPTAAAIQDRIEQFYQPYHQKLGELIQTKIDRFGKVYLLGLHSFMGLITEEICLGNADGTCSEMLLRIVEIHFSHEGYQVVHNKVFTGGYITRHYSKLPNVETLQIEVRYPVYLKSSQLDQPNYPDWQVPEFEQAQAKFEQIFGAIAQQISINLQQMSNSPV